ncbi:MAG: hypothetical protein AAGB00_02720 [Planctomycetota bacterium]
MSDPTSVELEFDCPLCSGAFEVESRWLGHEIACPHCGGVVTLAGDAPADPPDPEPAPAGDPPHDALPGEGLPTEVPLADGPASGPAPNPLAGIAASAELPTRERPRKKPGDKKPQAEPNRDRATMPSGAEPAAPPVTAAPPVPIKSGPSKLTPEERAALKRRINMTIAFAGAVLLVATFLLLSWLAQG